MSAHRFQRRGRGGDSGRADRDRHVRDREPADDPLEPRQRGGDTSTLVASQTGLATNSFTPAAVLAAGRYRIWVNATNAAGSSAWSTPFDFDVGAPLTMPTVPTGFAASNTNTTTPTVT